MDGRHLALIRRWLQARGLGCLDSPVEAPELHPRLPGGWVRAARAGFGGAGDRSLQT